MPPDAVRFKLNKLLGQIADLQGLCVAGNRTLLLAGAPAANAAIF